MNTESSFRTKIKCPNCGAVYAYSDKKLESDASLHCQNCGRRLEIDKETLEDFPKVATSDEPEVYIPWNERHDTDEEHPWQDIPRLLLHGFAFWVVFGPASLIWIPLIAISLLVGGILGLILILLAQLIFAGAINLGLARYLWEIHCKDDWKNLLAHGFLLLFVLDAIMLITFVVNITAIQINEALFILLQLLQLIVYAPIYGIAGQWIALQFEIKTEDRSQQIDTI